MKRYFLFALAVFFLACSKSDSPAVFADIYTRYEQDVKTLKAEAIFAEKTPSGKTSSVVFQNGVKFLGNNMEAKTLPGGVIRYELELKANLPETIPVHFTDNLKKEKKTDFQIPSIQGFEISDSLIKKSEGFTLKLDATPFDGKEKLVLIFTDANNQSLTLEVNASSAKPEITFAPGQLSKLAPGKVKVYLVRTGSVVKNDGRYTFNFQTEFYSQTKQVELE